MAMQIFLQEPRQVTAKLKTKKKKLGQGEQSLRAACANCNS